MQPISNVGPRTLKTALAVFLCLLLAPSEPFFACITAVICLQNTVTNSIRMALTRSIGTILGGMIGLLFLCICRYIKTFALSSYVTQLSTYFLIAIGIVLTIQFFNWIKRPNSINIACIVFLAVTTANAENAPLYYTVNRIVETLFGIVIALLVNRFITPPNEKESPK